MTRRKTRPEVYAWGVYRWMSLTPDVAVMVVESPHLHEAQRQACERFSTTTKSFDFRPLVREVAAGCGGRDAT